jgi:uncharacterized protein YraI
MRHIIDKLWSHLRSGPAGPGTVAYRRHLVRLVHFLTLACVVAVSVGTADVWANGSGRTLTDLNYRVGPGNPSPVLGTIPVNTTLTINCVVTNYFVAGPFGSSNLWDNVTWRGQAVFVADSWMFTGSAGAVAPPCGSTPAAPPVLQPTCNPQQVGSPCGPAAPPPAQVSNAEKAARWAEAHVGARQPAAAELNGNSFRYWSGWCEVFSEDAYRIGAGVPMPSYPTAAAHRAAVAGRLQGGVPPRGAIVLYRSTTASGHVAISVGGGNVVGTIGYMGQTNAIGVQPYTGNNGAAPGYAGWYMP